MNSEIKKLDNSIIQSFWIKAYFGQDFTSKPYDAIIDRAYRDFNRTLHGLGIIQTKEKYAALREDLKQIIHDLERRDFSDQDEFDCWHKEKCDALIKSFQSLPFRFFCFGQAQKWINMTLKYLTALNFESENSYRDKYHLFHIPIDNIIQDHLAKYGIPKIPGSWSRIKDYDLYLNYQKEVREKFILCYPLDIEFYLYNM